VSVSSPLACRRVDGFGTALAALVALIVLVATVMPTSVMAQIWPNARNAEAGKARALEELAREAAGAVAPRGSASSPPVGQAAPAGHKDLGASAPVLTGGAAPALTGGAAPVLTGATGSVPSAPMAAAGLASEISPRRFGLTLGDVFTQRIRLPDGLGALAQPSTDLRVGRVGTWFERRSVRREADTDGRTWLHIEHQVINVPTVTQAVQVPGFSLQFHPDKLVDVAPANASIGPLTPAEEASVEGTLRGLLDDRAPQMPSVRWLGQRLQWALAALAALLATWLAWWAHGEWRDARTKPFARALRQVQSADFAATEGQTMKAWVAVHHAFNAAAGRTVHASSLSPLFEHQPLLLAERTAIEQFFAASNARFFQPNGMPPLQPKGMPSLQPEGMQAIQPMQPEWATPSAAQGSFDVLGMLKRLRRLEQQGS
jgi:mxaA protein